MRSVVTPLDLEAVPQQKINDAPAAAAVDVQGMPLRLHKGNSAFALRDAVLARESFAIPEFGELDAYIVAEMPMRIYRAAANTSTVTRRRAP